MTTSAAVGSSLLEDGASAGRTAAVQAIERLGGEADLCLVFATTGYDQGALLAGVAEVTGAARISGCSGEGIIVGRSSHETDHAVAVMAIRSSSVSFEPILVEGYDADSRASGASIASAFEGRLDDALGVVVLPDGLSGNCTDFLDSLRQGLDVPVLIAGGTSADAYRFEKTYQYLDNEIRSGSVAAILIRGRGHLDVAVSHGCLPIGLERYVTREKDGWIHEIDERPAWEVFKEYLDGDPEDLNAEGIVHLCLGQALEEGEAEAYAPYVIRTPLRLDKDTGSLFFPGGGLATGQRIQLTRRDPARILESARACAESIRERNGGRSPELVVQFDCAGRGAILFGPERQGELVHPLQETLGADTPWIGFRTYGEIAPIAGKPYYHNYTVALCALYDDA